MDRSHILTIIDSFILFLPGSGKAQRNQSPLSLVVTTLIPSLCGFTFYFVDTKWRSGDTCASEKHGNWVEKEGL